MNIIIPMREEQFMSKTKKTNCDGLLDSLEPSLFREFYGIGVKIILQPSNWSFNGKVNIRKSIRGKSLVAHPNIQDMLEGFEKFKPEHFHTKDVDMKIIIDCIKLQIQYSKNMPKETMKLWKRKKKLSDFSKKMQKLCKRKFEPKNKEFAGIDLFSFSINKQFLSGDD